MIFLPGTTETVVMLTVTDDDVTVTTDVFKMAVGSVVGSVFGLFTSFIRDSGGSGGSTGSIELTPKASSAIISTTVVGDMTP